MHTSPLSALIGAIAVFAASAGAQDQGNTGAPSAPGGTLSLPSVNTLSLHTHSSSEFSPPASSSSYTHSLNGTSVVSDALSTIVAFDGAPTVAPVRRGDYHPHAIVARQAASASTETVTATVTRTVATTTVTESTMLTSTTSARATTTLTETSTVTGNPAVRTATTTSTSVRTVTSTTSVSGSSSTSATSTSTDSASTTA